MANGDGRRLPFAIRHSPFALPHRPADLEVVIQLHYTALRRGEFVMAAKALVQTRIDADVKEQATIVLENMGLTISDAVRILLTRTAKEAALPMELLTDNEAHDAWFRAKVREALEDKRPDVDDATVGRSRSRFPSAERAHDETT
jgi:DNA-damage-inducible protein J